MLAASAELTAVKAEVEALATEASVRIPAAERKAALQAVAESTQEPARGATR